MDELNVTYYLFDSAFTFSAFFAFGFASTFFSVVSAFTTDFTAAFNFESLDFLTGILSIVSNCTKTWLVLLLIG